ncbi:MAG TPA: DNA replication and repair protein RecF [Thermoleophilia bacterium]|nr:DNA replication and repair protein RecF [Thermoleophilia bacterium]
MFVSRLRLVNFRSYPDATVEFAPGLNVIVGRNASGKTNLLEGAWFALRASSPRTTKDDKAVRWGAGFARAEATVAAGESADAHTFTVAYAPGQAKQVRLDGADVASLDELRRHGAVFIFVPESLLLVKGSPARRRAHLDAFAAGIDPAYDAGLRDLNLVLKQRNAQLWRVREGAATDSLDAWDRQLARVALAFEDRRRAVVARLSASYRDFAAALAPGGGEFSLALVSQLDELPAAAPSAGGSDEEAFVAALRARRGGEIGRAVSGFGPHRDDLRFAEESAPPPEGGAAARDLRLFGSQGEQRAAVLALLLAERAVAAELTGDLGALLLDDVMSELDDARRRLLVGALTAGGQAIITTTNRLYFTAAELASAKVIELTGGAAGPDA